MSRFNSMNVLGKVGLGFLVLVFLMVLAACGASQPTATPSPTPTVLPTPEPTATVVPTVAPTEVPKQDVVDIEPTAAPEPSATLEPTPILAVAQGAAGGPGKIAFVSNRDGNPEIYLLNADGSNQARLTNDPAEDLGPAWSPDGAKIVFSSNRDGNEEIYVMKADGSSLTRLTNSDSHEVEPAWSPDGARIAYATRVGEGNWEIYVMDTDGSNQTRLTFDLERDGAPTWSPDGTRIAFLSTRQGHQEIYVMNADGSNQVPLLELEPTGIFHRHGRPAWSPDGTRIAFHSPDNENFDIYVVNADGTNQTRITDYHGGDFGPAWSPDGTRIAFLAERDGERGIYVMNADGSNVTRLTHTPDLVPSRPVWAPGRVSTALVAAPSPVPSTPAPTLATPTTSLELVGTALAEEAESPTAGVYVHGNYAFVGSQSVAYGAPHIKTGIRIVDISHPANPQLVGRIPLRSVEKFSDASLGTEAAHSHGDAVATRIESAAFQGDIAIVLQGVPDAFTVEEYPMPFGIWDVTNPADPRFLGPLSLGEHFPADSLGDKPNDTKAVNGHYFYAIYSKGVMEHPRDHSTDHHLAIVDLSDPPNPVVVGDWQDTVQVGLTGLSVNADGTRVYIIGQFGKEFLLYILDVQNPAKPVELGRFVWPFPFAGSFSPGRPVANADDTVLIFADGSWEGGRSSRLHILDISDLSSIREISTVAFPESDTHQRGQRWYWAHDLAIRGNLVYSTWMDGGVQLIDISDPANPVAVGGFSAPSKEN